MKGLLYKDMIVSKAMLIFLAACVLIASVISIVFGFKQGKNPEVVMFVTSLCAFTVYFLDTVLSASLFAGDERKTWISFSASSPLGMDGQIREKYYYIFIKLVIILFCEYITDTLTVAASGSVNSSASFAIMVIFCINVVYYAIEIPFMVRFGSGNGSNIKMTVFGIVIGLIVVYFLFGDISFLDSNDPIGYIVRFVTGSGRLYLITAFLYLTIPIYYLSYRISVKLYRKGAENYDN